ncbi:hypothetical protein C1Y63_06555 [Corynebacterium sp. 13CS0277]|uniref:HtaA domain-containing protein n=1 Tax=Corynebacterium sp. 13CS0277 TaxID=2071994 RepID=UPI000D02C84A|nr:HtaA domain-containing protein [Corynebacterium sp. 13CS0277]PRQ11363.1 hypothetical protein C1Y63_06555 [Corynebacterium sp. 13CS0277]
MLSVRSRRLAPAALALSVSLGAAALSAPAAVAAEAPKGCTDAAQITTTPVALKWNIKDSYISYVQGLIAQGTVTAGEGATFNAPFGPATYPATSGAGAYWNTPGTELDFGGSLHLQGHGGDMDVTVKNLKVKVTKDNAGELLGSYVVKGKDGAGKDQGATATDAVLAKVTFDAPVAKAAAAQSVTMKTVATEEITKLSSGQYRAGEELAEAVLRVTNAGDCVLPEQSEQDPQREPGFFDFSAEQRAEGSLGSGEAQSPFSGLLLGLVAAGVGLAALTNAMVAMGIVKPSVLPQLPPLPAELQNLLPR